MQEAKAKIIKCVSDYQKLFPDEYRITVDYLKERRKGLRKATAEVKGSDVLERALYEIPETLDNLINIRLDESETQWYRSKEGGRWFVNQFKQFASPEKL